VAQLTIVRVLFCGQGMTTLVECYADGVEKAQADFLVLVDCGGNKDYAEPALDYIRDKVLATKAQRLDGVVISHQDQDHVSLLRYLGERLKGRATVGRVYLGGLSWESSNTSTVKAFLRDVSYDENLVVFNAPYLSHYTGAIVREKLGYWIRYGQGGQGGGEMFIRVLVSGFETGARDIKKNASSTVIVVDIGSWKVVLPGDATYQTMLDVNTIMNIDDLLQPVAGLEIPHHGALRTAVEDYDAKKDADQFNFQIIKEFAGNLQTKWVMCSAGPWNTHKHPVEEVIDVFKGSLMTHLQHGYVAYVFERSDWQSYTNVVKAAYSTVEAIGLTAEASTSTQFKYKENKGKFIWGNIAIALGGAVALRPEEMVTFEPGGIIELGPEGEPVVFAPAP